MAGDLDYESFVQQWNRERASEPQRSIIFTEDWHLNIPRAQLARAKDYQHPLHLAPIVTLDEFRRLHEDQSFYKLSWVTNFVSEYRPARCTIRQGTGIWAHPTYIGPLYHKEWFPYHPNRGDGKYTMVYPQNIFDGKVRSNTSAPWDSSTNHFVENKPEEPFSTIDSEFIWRGYFTQFNDGDLYFTPLSKDSYMEGISATGYFCIDCDKILEGNPPGAVNVFPLRKGG